MSYCPSVTGSEISRFRPSSEVETEDVEEPRTFLQFTAKNVGNEKLSLLIVSTQKFCDRMKPHISEIVFERYNGNIFVKLAESIEQILDSGISNTTIDYIVIVFDTTWKNNIKKLKKEMLQIENSYVVTRRLSLVNGSPKDGIKGTDLEIAELAQQYNLLHLNGQVTRNKTQNFVYSDISHAYCQYIYPLIVQNNDSCKRLCERMLELVATSCGLNSGSPFIVPTAMDIFRLLFT